MPGTRGSAATAARGRRARRAEGPSAGRARPTYARRNRASWDRWAAAYERRHAPSLRGAGSTAWGLWRIPESDLRLLGEVRGRRVLELGCGAADWSRALARRGADGFAVDFSAARIRQGYQGRPRRGAPVRFAQATAERLPFRDASFDLVFCDWGAMTFADPRRTVPEAARVLRPGGRFVFSTDSPIRFLTYDLRRDRSGRRLARDYFDLHRLDFSDSSEFQLPFSGWITLFRRHHLSIERMVETRPTATTRSTYRSAAELAWSRRWPAETIWALTRDRPSPDGGGGRARTTGPPARERGR